jgi:asparagine synthase (glutamine-hydrolysing)
MCGIVGLLSKIGRPVEEPVLKAMTRALAHRGPDGEGWFSWGAGGFGHRRLAIIDPDAGHQPMASDDDRLHITYNGEIYNYRSLRETLEGHGHRFRTNSDTEVVLYAYRQWGSQCVLRFRGMFAFAIADEVNLRIFLARDHLGIKPLVYLDTRDVFAFASEIQALHHIPDLDLSVDPQAIDTYLQLQYIPAPQTIFHSVKKLRPGHTLTVSFDGAIGMQRRYWRPTFNVVPGRSEEEWLEGLDAVLRQSVRAHLVSDVPFGAFLSGGLDSTAIVAYMSDILDRPVKAFTIGFEETDFDETPWAVQAARKFGVEHHIEVLQPNALEILPDLVRHYGEPFGDSSAIPTYYVSKLASHHVPMVLSGDGGDELLAGYHRYRTWLRWITAQDRPRWRRFLYPLATRLRPQRYLPRRPSSKAWIRFVQATSPLDRVALWRREIGIQHQEPPSIFEEVFGLEDGTEPLQAVQSCDLQTYLPFDILTKVDVASMMNGLEVRTPLVDRVVVDYATSIPSRFNIELTPDTGFQGKLLLKKLLGRSFPEAFLNRPKQGFGVPIQPWFGPGGIRTNEVRDRLTDPGSPLGDYFDPVAVSNVATDTRSSYQWLLLFLDEWLRNLRKPPRLTSNK